MQHIGIFKNPTRQRQKSRMLFCSLKLARLEWMPFRSKQAIANLSPRMHTHLMQWLDQACSAVA